MSVRGALGVFAVLTSLAAGLVPAPARADSIVLTLRGDVVRVDPDRPREQVVVRRGARGVPWVAVSQADDGSVVAQRGRTFQRMTATGRFRGRAIDADPRPQAPSAYGPFDPEVSPDGRYLTWWNGFNFVVSLPTLIDAFGNLTDTVNTFSGQAITQAFFPNQITTNSSPARELEGSVYGPWGSWYGNRGIVTGDPKRGGIDYDALDGSREPVNWFIDTQSANALAPRVSRRRDRLAFIQHARFGEEGTSPRDQIRVYALAGPPPALPPGKCVIAARGSSFRELSRSPDGRRLAWSDARGVWIAGAPRNIRPDGPTCSLRPRPRLLVSGGDEPHWGPGPVRPAG